MREQRRKKSQYKKFVGLIVLLLLIVGSVFFYFKMATPVKEEQIATVQPKKTNAPDGYIDLNNTEAATGSMPLVIDSGNPKWVKVNSREELSKFKNLSTNEITIYRINNPKVLKTVTNKKDGGQRIKKIIKKYPDSLIMNASGFELSTGNVLGLTINNGKLIRDWTAGKVLQYAFVINKDGSSKIYDSTTPASKIIRDGGQQSYNFGGAIIRDGKLLPSDGSLDWMIHVLIGNDKDNNLYVIITPTNAGYLNIMRAIRRLDLENLLLLDGGGSSQLALKGKMIVKSQDNRAVPDYIVMR